MENERQVLLLDNGKATRNICYGDFVFAYLWHGFWVCVFQVSQRHKNKYSKHNISNNGSKIDIFTRHLYSVV